MSSLKHKDYFDKFFLKIKIKTMKNLLFIVVIIFTANLTQAQWEATVRLTNDPALSYTEGCSQRNIASDGDLVHVVWEDERDGNWELYYKRSTDGGVSWGADTRLTNNLSDSEYPSITVSGAVVHIVWQDDRDGDTEIYYKRSTDGCLSWGPDTRLTNATDKSYIPSVGVSDSVVSVVWYDYRDGNPEIYYKRSTNGGLNWSTDKRLTNDSADSYFPSVAVNGSTVSVVWSDKRDMEYVQNKEIYYKRSSDGGISWGADTRLKNSAGWSDYPCVTASGAFVHAVWQDWRSGLGQVYYKRSADGGINWDAEIPLTYSTYESAYASVFSSDSVVHVVWMNYSDIHYKRSTDGGLSWGQYARLTNYLNLVCPSITASPSVSVSDSVVHVVWCDRSDAPNYEIYYKRNPNGGLIGIKESDIVKNDINVFPNPASDNITISFSNTGLSKISISIFNSLGIEIKRFKEMELVGENAINFSIESFPTGVYYCTLNYGTKKISRSFLVLR